MDIYNQLAGMGPAPVFEGFIRGQQLRQQNALADMQMAQAKQEQEAKNQLLQLRNQLATAAPEAREGMINNLFAIDQGQGAAAKKFYGVGEDAAGAGINNEFGINPLFGQDQDGNTVVMQLSKKGGVQLAKLPEGVRATKPLAFGDTGAELIGRDVFTGDIRTRAPKQLAPNQTLSYQEKAAETQARVKGAAERDVNKTERMANAQEVLELAKLAEPHLKVATGSLGGVVRDAITGSVGISTEGAKAISALQPIAGSILMKMPRNPGPASDRDVVIMAQMAGRLDDPLVPPDQKVAAFNTLVTLGQRVLEREAGMQSQAPKPKTAKDLPGYREKTPPKSADYSTMSDDEIRKQLGL